MKGFPKCYYNNIVLFLYKSNIRYKDFCSSVLLLCNAHASPPPPLDYEMRWTGELWLKTNLLKRGGEKISLLYKKKWQNKYYLNNLDLKEKTIAYFIYFSIKKIKKTFIPMFDFVIFLGILRFSMNFSYRFSPFFSLFPS